MPRVLLRILSCFLSLLLMISIGAPSDALAKKAQGNPKYASIVMDADTGMILSQRYADKSLHPASLTKMMTLLLTFESLDRGLIRKSDRVRISNRAASMVPSKLGLPAGSSIKVEDAIYALVTKSANDVAVALAEHIGGSESKFARLMTARARTIGMRKTNFRNASGLHNKYQVSSARDMAKLGRYILQRYPHYYRYFSTKKFTYRGKTYRSHNRLMNSYKGMDGFKTGYINASGFNLVASAYQDGRRLIGVVFGGRSSKTRNAHMKEILDGGFKKASRVRFAHVKAPAPKRKPSYGTTSKVASVSPSRAAPQNMSGFTSIISSRQSKDNKQNVANNTIQPNYTALSKALQSGAFGEMIGEGDFDPSVSKRLETGLIAVAVHKGEYKPNPAPASAVEKSLRNVGHAMVAKIGQDNDNMKGRTLSDNTTPSIPHPKDIVGKWSVQIGAFNNRLATDEALQVAQKKLPPSLATASPMSVPLRTAEGMIFRARLGGLSQAQAKMSCIYLKDCMIIAPISTRISAQ